jgi:hypothetical protein
MEGGEASISELEFSGQGKSIQGMRIKIIRFPKGYDKEVQC